MEMLSGLEEARQALLYRSCRS